MTKKNKFNKQVDNIQESLTLGSNPSFENGGGLNVGGKGMRMGPEQISFLDIIAGIAKEKRKRQPDSPIIGYPLQNHIPDELADVVEKLSNVTGKFYQAGKNPVIKDNKKAHDAVIRILKKLKKSGGILMSLKKDLDDLVVEY